jgi:uncharacterized protein (TIGR01777 family)
VRIAITASTGLIGTALGEQLDRDGTDVLRLVRRPPAAGQYSAGHPGVAQWDPTKPDGGLSAGALDGVDAVVHLSGAPIASGPWTAARKQELRASRIGSTSALIRAMLAARTPPPVLLAASAVGWYGDTGAEAVDERAPNGEGFLATLVRDWEQATIPARAAGVRVVNVRSGIVLSSRGGMLKPLLVPFRLGLGAKIGSGMQYVSWITLTDHIAALRFLLGRDDIAGPVNLTAPVPVTNAELTRALAKALHRPAVLRVPSGPLRFALGELSTELLGSNRVLPARLEAAGFSYAHPTIEPAVVAAIADAPRVT